MSNQDSQIPQSADSSTQLPPPNGDAKKADRYINQLIGLISADKLTVLHTDLSRFDPTSLQDHYRLDLKDYEIEISHNKKPDSGEDFYVILFNNLKYINGKCMEKIILAYLHLDETQFKNFKSVSDEQLEKKRKEAEEKRFREAMAPVDQMLEQLTTSTSQLTEDNAINVNYTANTADQNGPIPDNSGSTPLDNIPSTFAIPA